MLNVGGRSTAGLATAAAGVIGTPTVTRRLVRGADQLDIVVELFDAVVDGDGNVAPSGPEPLMRLTFGSQHTTEQTFDGVAPVPPTAGIDHIAAGDSVVVVPVTGPFPFTLDGVLDTATGRLAAQDSAAPPDGSVTAVEVPAGLVLSPAGAALLVAARRPFTTGDTTEVWTARVEPAGGSPTLELAAVHHAADPLLPTQVPSDEDRGDIVTNSLTEAPITARRLWLSSSGAFADLHGEWTGGITDYDHLVAAGRDAHVQVLALGHLLPFGHRAAIAEVSTRAFLDDTAGEDAAVMQVTHFLTIVEPTVTRRAFAQHEGRGLPLAALTATTSETTPITLEEVLDLAGDPIEGVHDLRAAGADHLVDYRCVDRGGDTVSFALPATFVDDANAYVPGVGKPLDRLRLVANSLGRLDRREVDLGGQRVSYADSFAGGQTGQATHRFRLAWEGPDAGASKEDLEDARDPAVYAVLEDADVVPELAGSATGATGSTVRVALHRRWLESGNGGGNFDLAYLTISPAVSSLIGADSALGGVAQFDMLAEVFNQSAGVGLDLPSADAPWDPTKLVGEASKIIGNISLADIINAVVNGVPGLDVPGTSVTVTDDSVIVEFTFCPSVHDLPAVGFRTVPGTTRCCLHVTTVISFDESIEASFETEMRVENFFLDFPPIIDPPPVSIDVESVTATIGSDGSTAILPKIRSWEFTGLLSLLMALVDSFGTTDFDLKISPELIDVDSTINLPDISLGVAEIRNFAVNLGVELPLDDGAGLVSVGIGSKSSPLDIDVMMFGATFWLDIDLGFSGGAAPAVTTTSMGVSVYWEMLDFDIVVVKIAFALRLAADWKLTAGEVSFTGAVSLEGQIDVLGLVSVSASLVASLGYESRTEVMVLKGTVNYCVDTFLGKLTSGSVPIGATEIELGDGQGAIAGARAGGTSSFADRYREPVWADYCDAFA